MFKQKITPYINWIKFGLGLLTIISIFWWVIYATYIWNDMSTFNAWSWTILSSDTWNKMLTNINYLKQEVDTLKSSSTSSNLVKEIIVWNWTDSDKTKYVWLWNAVSSVLIDGLDCTRDWSYNIIITQSLASNNNLYVRLNNINYSNNTLWSRWWLWHNVASSTSVVWEWLYTKEQLIWMNSYSDYVSSMSQYRILCDWSQVTTISEFIQHTSSVHYSNYISTRIFSIWNVTSLNFFSNNTNWILPWTKITIKKF